MDRGMAGEDNVEFSAGRRAALHRGTAKNSLRKFERELRSEDWRLCMQGWKCGSRRRRAARGFILCRSAERRAKEQAMHERFEKRIEEGLGKIQTSCLKKNRSRWRSPHAWAGCWADTRAAALFEVKVEADAGGFAAYGGPSWKPARVGAVE